MRPSRRVALPLALSLAFAACGDDADSTAPVVTTVLASPLDRYDVIQGFAWNAARQSYHLANDLDASAGDSVRAPASGRVIYAKTEVAGYGGIVLMEHRPAGDGPFVTLYGHLSAQRGLLVEAGDSLSAGDPIGTIADDFEDGGPWQPHLHFGVRPGSGDLEAEVCGVWLYVGYSRTCDGWSHEAFRDQWVDPQPMVQLPGMRRAPRR